MSDNILIATLLLAPLLGFLFNGLRYKSENYMLAGTVATGAAFVGFLCSLALFFKLTGLPVDAREIKVTFF